MGLSIGYIGVRCWYFEKNIKSGVSFIKMENPEDTTLKGLYNLAEKKYKDIIKKDQYLPIIVASSISAATGFFLTKWNFQRTGINLILDILLVALFVTFIFAIIIFISLKLIRFLDRFSYFLGLVWKYWKPFRKTKK